MILPIVANKQNIIGVELIKNENEFLLTYLDNGPGIPDEFDISESSSMGLKLVYLLTEELYGSVEYEKNGFSKFKIKFRPKFKN